MEYNQNNSNVNNPQYLQQMMQQPTEYNYQNITNVNNPQYSQQTMEQQMIYQQMMNQMMQQPTGYNYQNNINVNNPQYSQQQVGYGGENNYQTNQLQSIKIRNLWSLISAVLLFIAMVSSEFVHCIDWGDWEKSISLSELCTYMRAGTKGWESNYKIFFVFASCMFYLTVATFIISVLGGFIDVTNYKKWANIISILCFAVLTIIILKGDVYGDETSLGTGYYVLCAGIVISIVSVYKNNPPMHSLTANNDLQAR